jgi:hypothetical protein
MHPEPFACNRVGWMRPNSKFDERAWCACTTQGEVDDA